MAGTWEIEYREIAGKNTGVAKWWDNEARLLRLTIPTTPPSFSFNRGNLQAADRVSFLTECVERRNVWQTAEANAAARQTVADGWAAQLNAADPQSEV